MNDCLPVSLAFYSLYRLARPSVLAFYLVVVGVRALHPQLIG